MSFLNKELLLQKSALEIEKVFLTDTDFVFVKEMTAREKEQFEKSIMTAVKDNKGTVTGYETSLDGFRGKLACLTVCDEDGNLILTNKDYVALSESLSASKMEKLIEVAQRLNKIAKEEKDELVKNLEADPSGNSNLD